MALLPIIKFPDERLRQQAAPIDVFDEELQTLARDLLDTMYAAPGVGITLCHVGILKRLTVIDLEKGKPRYFVNPSIVWSSEDISQAMEGSVSMPGVTGQVKRPARVRVVYQDLSGARHEEETSGFLATCLQHEIDQLDGIFWLERLSKLKRDMIVKRYKTRARQSP